MALCRFSLLRGLLCVQVANVVLSGIGAWGGELLMILRLGIKWCCQFFFWVVMTLVTTVSLSANDWASARNYIVDKILTTQIGFLSNKISLFARCYENKNAWTGAVVALLLLFSRVAALTAMYYCKQMVLSWINTPVQLPLMTKKWEIFTNRSWHEEAVCSPASIQSVACSVERPLV